jgi:hypothetical protein
MERLSRVLAGVVLCVPLVVTAADQPGGMVGVYATNTTVEVPGFGFDGDGTGFGVRGWFSFGVPFAHFEYQTVTVEDDSSGPGAEVDVDQLRVGGGAGFKASDAVTFMAKAEYIDMGDVELDGFGVHGGAHFMATPALHFGASLGYLMLSGDDVSSTDTDGLEINLGAGFMFTKMVGAFLDYRTFMGAFDNAGPGVDDELTISDIRAGVVLAFGGR